MVDKGMQGRLARVMSVEREGPKSRTHLTELAVKYFKKEGYKVNKENATLDGYSGATRHFDLIVQKGRQEQGVWVRDWNRTVGVNLIIGLDTASEDVGLGSPIMIADKFSDHAKSYSNRRKITLLTKQKMGSFM
ncbi:MAG: restriction endonuclease [Candidatus Bathyarchaeia archaeon]